MGAASSKYGPAERRNAVMAAPARWGAGTLAPRFITAGALLDVAGLFHMLRDFARGLVHRDLGGFGPGERRVHMGAEDGLHRGPLGRPRTPERRRGQRVGHRFEEGVPLVEAGIGEDRLPERDAARGRIRLLHLRARRPRDKPIRPILLLRG